ncbi:8-amino-7-oxononanoate synthase [Pseudovibrio denitrificans]|uniref:8-amino-7-oxononanoate synthase n=1 Tax=Pseudovibrio denitrificans TaxID=258256 RepID=A0A1I6XIR0_9HYPH|nr:8-amino-7-oxononanoate synthase [Pseudovibrio denitrificans]SFT37977.1 8-amino-7-oxononanoate synthase [Pseudovibrio denitrificans]
MSLLNKHQGALERLAERGRSRSLLKAHGCDFSSNDYLALTTAPELRLAAENALQRGVGMGAGGSRLLRGNDPEHEALEEEAAKLFGAERTLFFGGGYNANLAMFSTLPQNGDLVLHDSLIHASAHDGIKLGSAQSMAFRHNQVDDAQDRIRQWREQGGTGRIWLACESLYSMDGDQAPIRELVELADQRDAFLLVDEAHATGVLGKGGRGLAAEFEGRENVISLHTCGKALGASGALVCGPSVMIDYLINRARAFIYATAPSPLVAAIVRASLQLVQSQPQRREQLADLVAHANAEMERLCGQKGSGTHILPFLIGDDKRTMRIAKALQETGYDIRGIRPPTVPRGTSRLRIALTLHASKADVSSMFEVLAEEMDLVPS